MKAFEIQKLRLLIIDDDEDDFFITSSYLNEIPDFEIESVWSYQLEDAKKQLLSNAFDLYFVDFRLGAQTGLELLKEAISGGCTKPIILLTGIGNREIDKKAIENGAYDYLIKSELNPEKLERSIRYALERFKSFNLLAENERKFRLIFENVMSFIFTCDENLVFKEANPAAEYFFNCSPESLKNRKILEIFDAETRKQIHTKTRHKTNITNLTFKHFNQNNEPIVGNLSMNFFENTSSGESYWQGIIFDESMRSRAELAKFQTEKLEATQRVVGTLAHEIRNPLTNIGLSIDGIIEIGLQEQQMIYAKIVKRSALRINEIITELLNSSKEIELRFEEVDLNELVQEVVQIAQDSSQLKQVDIQMELAHHPVFRSIDREKFKIALQNLVFNAIEACNKEKSVLQVKLVDSPNEPTALFVKDNGSGIKEEDLNKLFEPYFTTKKNGMGLGLVATLNIIKSHKAQIEVQSQLGIGTTFKIIFEEASNH